MAATREEVSEPCKPKPYLSRRIPLYMEEERVIREREEELMRI